MIKQERKIKQFYNYDIVTALKACINPKQKGGAYEAQFMPGIIDERMNTSDHLDPIWNDWYTSLSLKATGKSKQGNAIVVYAHVPHELSTPEGIQTAIDNGLVDGAGKLSKNEFYRLLDLEDGENVFVVDYNILKNSSSGVIFLTNALAHPQTIPFLGGEDRSEAYLKKHKEVYGCKINIGKVDGVGDEPMGRLLFIGNTLHYCYDGGNLGGSNELDTITRFLGINEVSIEDSAKNIGKGQLKVEVYTPNQISQVLSKFGITGNLEKKIISALKKEGKDEEF